MKERGQTGRRQSRGSTSSTARRIGGRIARLVGLFVVILLVVIIGVGLRDVEPAAPEYSASQQAQLDAEDRFRAIAADAREAAAAEPGVAPELLTIAADLLAQADAIALPQVLPVPGAGPATDDGPAEPGAPHSPAASEQPPPPTSGQVLTQLRASSLSSLQDAVHADPGPGRLLASVGVNQWRHTGTLAAILGEADGLPAAGPALASHLADAKADATAAASAPAGDCAGAPLGPDADRQALLTAKRAEDQAAYGYEVAAALLPDPVPALALSAAHASAAGATADRLGSLCAPAAPAPAGFGLDPAFRADPAASLRVLEHEHAKLYADLVASVGPATRPWAIASLLTAVQRSVDAGAPLTPFPGIPDPGPGAAFVTTEPAGDAAAVPKPAVPRGG